MKQLTIDKMVSAFLGWKLPVDFAPDCHITFDRELADSTPHQWPIGTNLFNAEQARSMIEYMIEAANLEVLENGKKY